MHDRLMPSPRELVTTIPVDEESGTHILYSTFKDMGYDLRFEVEEADPSNLRVTADPATAQRIERIRDDINREGGDLRPSINALLEPWDGLIEDISSALDYPTSVSRVLSEAHTDSNGVPQPHSHLAELFVLAYERGGFGDPNAKATYKKIPFDDKKATAIKERLKIVYNGLREIGVRSVTKEETEKLLGRVIQDYLRPRPYLQPLFRPQPIGVQPQR